MWCFSVIDLTEIVSRDVRTPNADGQVGYTAAELEQIIAYYKNVMARRGDLKKDGTPKKPRTRKGVPRQINLEDLIYPRVVRKIAP
jgi:hypothetical protein